MNQLLVVEIEIQKNTDVMSHRWPLTPGKVEGYIIARCEHRQSPRRLGNTLEILNCSWVADKKNYAGSEVMRIFCSLNFSVTAHPKTFVPTGDWLEYNSIIRAELIRRCPPLRSHQHEIWYPKSRLFGLLIKCKRK